MVELKLVIIYGRLYITSYSQVNIIFDSQIIMVFNESPEKRFTYSSFSRSAKKKMGGFKFWIESDA